MVESPSPCLEVQGILHVHSHHSDGSGSVPDIIEAAKRAGVDFLVLTDHDTVKARADGWEGWHGSSLLIVGEEVTTQSGHCLAVGASDSIPRRRTAGEAIRRIREQGGLSFIAHPHGVCRPFLRTRDHSWKDWGVNSYTGIEVWSYMFDWASRFRAYRWGEGIRRPDGLIAGPDPRTLALWDVLCRNTRIVGIGGVDAHARRYPLINKVVFPYEDSFRTVRTHVLLSGPLTRDAPADRAAILNGLASGHCFAAYEPLAPASGFRFSAPCLGLVMGDEARFTGEVELVAESPRRAPLRLVKDGRACDEAEDVRHAFRTRGPGVYRAEARLGDRPWIFANPIYLRP